jgi:mono/diheme cytochrome c family protein
MRERLAEILAAFTAALVVVLAAAFSLMQNAPREASAPAPQADAAVLAAGREAYARHGCAGCHAIAGEGNPRFPLDGVGARLAPPALRDWIVASEAVRPQLPASAARLKQRYAALPPEELQALVDYLASLRAAAR